MGQRLRVFYLLMLKKYEALLYELLALGKDMQRERLLTVEKLRTGSRLFSQFMKRMQKMPPGVQVRRSLIAGRPCFIATPDTKPKRTILYLHGGGWILGLEHLSHYRSFIAHLAKTCEAEVWAIDYRLVPEHEVEDGLEDCYQAYLKLLQDGVSPEDLHVVGDSAGGSLTLALLIKLRDEGKTLPRSAVVMSPATGVNPNSGSYVERLSSDPFFTQEFIDFISNTVFEGNTFDASRNAPLNRDLHDLPPLMIVVGGREILLDDSVFFAHKARASGVDVVLDQTEEGVHVYPIFVDVLPQSRPALERIATFLKT